ncbi:MAG: DUF362 domain-containing protein [Thermodesulfobacteriota bacterium]|nr:MAG: DUF362 domain-containing protein [Thermodesulfobacteriota bacterium]
MAPPVSITRCSTYGAHEVERAVGKAVELAGGMEKFVKRGERILLKPNLLSAKPSEKAVTTHPSVVHALIALVRRAGATPVVGDSPGIGSAQKVAQRCGVLDVCVQTDTPLIDLKTLEIVENPGGHTFKRLEVAREALDFDGIINIPKVKTHAQMYLTLGVKNLFGCVPGKRKPQWHLSAGVDGLQFASMLLDLAAFLSPRLTLADGIVAMEGNGPSGGDPRELGLLFCSADCLAMDAVIASVLGADPSKSPVLRAAISRGQASADAGNITVAGERIEDVRVKDFRFPPPLNVNFASSLPDFLDKRIRKALTSRPHIDATSCTLCKLCLQVCPAGVMTGAGRIRIDYDMCIRCYCCQEMCPPGAISARDGWLKRLLPGF